MHKFRDEEVGSSKHPKEEEEEEDEDKYYCGFNVPVMTVRTRQWIVQTTTTTTSAATEEDGPSTSAPTLEGSETTSSNNNKELQIRPRSAMTMSTATGCINPPRVNGSKVSSSQLPNFNYHTLQNNHHFTTERLVECVEYFFKFLVDMVI